MSVHGGEYVQRWGGDAIVVLKAVYDVLEPRVNVDDLDLFFFQAEDGIRDSSVTGVQTCAFFFQAEDGIRDSSVTGVQTCALPIQAEDGIRDSSVTGVQTCALPIDRKSTRLNSSHIESRMPSSA